MRFFTLLFSLVILQSCFWSSRQTTSEWTVLKTSANVKCSPWPLHERDYEINRLEVAAPDDPFLLAQGRLRSSQPARYWAKFDGGIAIDPDHAIDIRLGPNALVAGGMTIDSVPHVVVVQNDGGRSKLEVRTVRDNIVRASSVEIDSAIAWATIKSVKDGFWIIFERSASESDYGINESSAESRFSVAFVAPAADNTLSIAHFPEAAFTSAPILLPSTDGKSATAIWVDGAPANKESPFRWRDLRPGEKPGAERTLEAPVDAQIESWTTTVAGGDVLLAWVDGDTLVGDAKLRLARFERAESGLNPRFRKDADMPDTHASEPVWSVRGDKASLLLLQWMDEESSLASYHFTSTDVAPPRYFGVFPKGTRLMETFGVPGDDRTFATIRYRNGNASQWKFEVCDFGTAD